MLSEHSETDHCPQWLLCLNFVSPQLPISLLLSLSATLCCYSPKYCNFWLPCTFNNSAITITALWFRLKIFKSVFYHPLPYHKLDAPALSPASNSRSQYVFCCNSAKLSALLCSVLPNLQCVLHGRDGMGVGVGLCRYTQGLGEVEWKLRVIGLGWNLDVLEIQALHF